MVKLAEIAEKAGFSIPMVSRVLSPNPHKGARVAEKTRKQIENVARELGYIPNRNAEFLKRGKNPVIGCFLPARPDSLLAKLVKGIGEEAEKQNFPLSFYFDMTQESYLDFIGKSSQHKNCGIITYPYFKVNSKIEKVVDEYQKNGGKLVLIESGSNRWQWHNSISVSVDNYHGGKSVAEYLLSKGVSRVWTTKYVHIPERVDGFISTMTKAKCPVDIINMDPSQKDASDSAIVEEWLNEICNAVNESTLLPLGIYIPSDRTAMSMVYRLLEKGIKVGANVLLIGYDGLYAGDSVYPALTTVVQPFEEVGRASVRMMIRSIYEKDVLSTLIEPELFMADT